MTTAATGMIAMSHTLEKMRNRRSLLAAHRGWAGVVYGMNVYEWEGPAVLGWPGPLRLYYWRLPWFLHVILPE